MKRSRTPDVSKATVRPSRQSAHWIDRRNLISAVPAVAVAAVVLGAYFRFPATGLGLALAVLAALFLLRGREARTCAADWAVLLVLVYEVPSLLFSQYRANSLRFAETIAVSAALYYFIRLTIRLAHQKLILSALLGGFGAYLGATCVVQFGAHYQELQSAGLSGVVPFRSRLVYAPFPYVSGEWLTLLVLTLPFACAVAASLWRSRRLPAALALAAAAVIAAAMILSCSRAVFWSAAVFFGSVFLLAGVYRLLRARTALIAMATAVGSLGVLLTLENAAYPGVLAAYAGRHTSQTRSTEGRLAIWERSRQVLQGHTFLGVGSGNAPLFLNPGTSQDDTAAFASSTFSLPVQILAEKGVIGAACYVILLVVVGWAIHRRLRSGALRAPDKLAIACLAAGLIAVLFRELTYASLFEQTPNALLLSVVVGLLSAGSES